MLFWHLGNKHYEEPVDGDFKDATASILNNEIMITLTITGGSNMTGRHVHEQVVRNLCLLTSSEAGNCDGI